MLQLRYPQVIAGPPRPSMIIRPGGRSRCRPAWSATRSPAAARSWSRSRPATRSRSRNVEGGQACELVAIDSERPLRSGDPRRARQQQCRRAEGAACRRRRQPAAVSRRGSSAAASTCRRRRPSASSAPTTPAGTEESFVVQRDGVADRRRPRRPDAGRRPGHDDAAHACIVRRATIRSAAKFELARSAGRSGARSAHPFGDGGVLFRQGRRLHPDHRRRRAPVHRLPVLFGAQARQGQGSSARRDDDAHADGRRAIRCPACIRNITTRTWSRWSRWCRTPAAGTMPSRSPARPNITTTSAIPATSTARTISTRRWPTRA